MSLSSIRRRIEVLEREQRLPSPPAQPNSTMSPEEFKAAKESLGLTWARLAPVLGYAHGQTLRHFADGSRPIPHLVAMVMRLLRDLPAAREAVGL